MLTRNIWIHLNVSQFFQIIYIYIYISKTFMPFLLRGNIPRPRLLTKIPLDYDSDNYLQWLFYVGILTYTLSSKTGERYTMDEELWPTRLSVFIYLYHNLSGGLVNYCWWRRPKRRVLRHLKAPWCGHLEKINVYENNIQMTNFHKVMYKAYAMVCPYIWEVVQLIDSQAEKYCNA